MTKREERKKYNIQISEIQNELWSLAVKAAQEDPRPVTSGGILGYSSGLSGKRVIAPTIMVSFLVALIVFLKIDLDRQKRGFIQVNQSSMIMLQDNYHE